MKRIAALAFSVTIVSWQSQRPHSVTATATGLSPGSPASPSKSPAIFKYLSDRLHDPERSSRHSERAPIDSRRSIKTSTLSWSNASAPRPTPVTRVVLDLRSGPISQLSNPNRLMIELRAEPPRFQPIRRLFAARLPPVTRPSRRISCAGPVQAPKLPKGGAAPHAARRPSPSPRPSAVPPCQGGCRAGSAAGNRRGPRSRRRSRQSLRPFPAPNASPWPSRRPPGIPPVAAPHPRAGPRSRGHRSRPRRIRGTQAPRAWSKKNWF